MYSYANKTSENESQAVAGSLPKRQGASNTSSVLVDNRPGAVAQRKMQEAIAASSRNIIQRVTTDELQERGNTLRRADARFVPESGVNLWRMENQPEDALIYLLGTAHGLTLPEIGVNAGARNYLIGFLQQENFSHVFTEMPLRLDFTTYEPDLAGKLEAKIQAQRLLNEEFPGGQPVAAAGRRAFLHRQNTVTSAESSLQRIDKLQLDDSYATIATVRPGDRPRPVLGALETNDTKLAAHMQNIEDLGISPDDEGYRLRRAPDEPIPSNDSVIRGNQQTLFVEASEEMLAGRDIADSEERNRQWMERVRNMNLVNRGDRQLWIIGAAHLPGLILRFSELGWRPHHMAPPAVGDP